MVRRISIKGCMAFLISLSVLHVVTNIGLWVVLTDTRIRQHSSRLHANASGIKTTARVSTLYPAKYDTEFLLHNRDACLNRTNISLLFVVNSAPGHFKHRQILRTTFANGLFFLPHVVKAVFLIGRVTNSTVARKIVSEFAEHKDLVQGDFIDDYRNLTLKISMGLKWVSLYCRNVELIGKIDDDTFVNTHQLLAIEQDIRARDLIYCDIATESVGKIWRIKSKWAVDVDVFKFYRYFPWTYCGGYAVFIPGKLIPNLYKASLISPFIWIDDVYFTGTVVSRLDNARHHQGAFVRSDFKMQPKKGLECFRKPDCHVLATTVDIDYIPEFWRLVRGVWTMK
ncbi:lactosylceramide 1,3-N-acetyl-beta-D-glucosaminyltransferase A-like [Haliotis cracherodii]|uniref:lactosylceramide 1,3-N-acetyl-beta-D-glucosaminyltransferase A-like n=1 Tax=Haliotis cracherodii TaxID=6455 RepID=UPI0039EC4F1A